MKWNIYYADREYAREIGDPVLATIEVDDKLSFREAQLAAEKAAILDSCLHLPYFANYAGFHAWPAPDPQNAGPGDPDHDLAYDPAPSTADEEPEVDSDYP